MTKITPTRIPSSLRNLLATVLLLALTAAPALAAAVVETRIAGGDVSWQINRSNAGSTLSVHNDDGALVHRANFEAGVAPSFQPPADGGYRWSLTVKPRLTAEQQAELAAARLKGDDSRLARFEGAAISGRFVVQNGVISETGLDLGSDDRDNPTRDQVIADDLIVTGSTCVGFDCVNGESFGFDTIRLKENNTRIKFEDTSTGTFPSTDWQLTANDSASGGANKFSIEDITGAKVPFTVTGGAATNSIFVDSTGRVGFRTATPVLDLHVNTSNTPALRLEQNNSGGFTAQTWDIAGNEANFFVRDVTGGSRLPFRIRPGAPTSSIDIAADGEVGIGTASPSAALHVSKSTNAFLEGIKLSNNNEARISVENTALTARYIMAVNNTAPGLFFISRDGGGGTIVEVNNRLDAGGFASVKVNGSIQATNVIFASSRELKESFSQLDPQEILAKVAELPVTRWRFKEGSQVEHIGPMAEDFHEVFGLNSDPKTISMTDTSGVALAAIQGLLQQVKELQQQNAGLTERLQQLEGLVAKQ